MTPVGMTALRVAAFVCHTLPDVRLRLRHEERLLAEIGWDVPVGERAEGDVVHLRPCQLRSAVNQAWEHQRAGRRLGVLGLADGVDPVVELGVRGQVVQHPGGILTVACVDRWIHAFAVTLELDEVRRAIACDEPDEWSGASTSVPVEHVARVDLHHDEMLGVTLVWTETSVPALPHPSGRADDRDATLEMMRRLLAACAVAEFENELHQLV